MENPEISAPAQPESGLRFIRQSDVMQRTGLSRSTLYELINTGRFPKPLKLCGGRINCWPEHVVQDWMQARIDECNADAA